MRSGYYSRVLSFIKLSTSAIVDTWEVWSRFNNVMDNWCVHLHGAQALQKRSSTQEHVQWATRCPRTTATSEFVCLDHRYLDSQLTSLLECPEIPPVGEIAFPRQVYDKPVRPV